MSSLSSVKGTVCSIPSCHNPAVIGYFGCHSRGLSLIVINKFFEVITGLEEMIFFPSSFFLALSFTPLGARSEALEVMNKQNESSR
jgi:hypothetical protein